MKMIDKYGSTSSYRNENIVSEYTENMRTFFAVPGVSVDGGNIISNAQFDSGTSGWSSVGGSNSVSSNILSNTSNGASLYNSVYQSTSYSTVVGNKIYVKARVRVINSDCLAFWIRVDGLTTGTAVIIKSIPNPDINIWYDISGILTTPADYTGNYLVQIYHVYSSAASGKVMEIDGTSNHGVLVVDLTDIFGAGNEPDVDYCDAFYEQFFAFTGTDYHGQIRAKIDCPTDADALEIRAKNTGAWTTNDDMTTGWLCGTIDEYVAGTTYAVDDWVIYSGTIYKSLLGSNIGNTPDSSPTYWIDASDVDNNEWYTFMGTGLRNFVRAFPSKNGAYNETNYLPASCVHEYLLDGNPYDRIGDADGDDTDVEYVDAVNGEAGYFNGSASYIDCGSSSDFNRAVKSVGNGCTYECWFNAFSWGTGSGSSTAKQVWQDNNGWNMGLESTGSGIIRAVKYVGSVQSVSKTGLSLNTWYHAVVRVNADYTVDLFINGTDEGTISNTTIPNNNTEGINIGEHSEVANVRYWDGLIDQVRFYNTSLSPAEITALYEDPTSTPPSSCVHEYLLDGDATDSVGSANGTEYSMEYVSAVVDKAGYFNGSTSYIDCGTPSDFNRAVKSISGCSYEFWMNANSFVSSNIIVDYNGWVIGIGTDGTGGENGIGASKYANSVSHSIVKTGYSTGIWYHVLLIMNTDFTMELFVDGVSVGSNSNTEIPQNNTSGLKIGYSLLSFDGLIDQVRFYTRPLTQSEITSLYNEGHNIGLNESSAKGGGLAHEWNYDNISGSSLLDSAGGANLTNTNVSIIDGKVGNAGDYNGSTGYTSMPDVAVPSLNTSYSFDLWTSYSVASGVIWSWVKSSPAIQRGMEIRVTDGFSYLWRGSDAVNHRVATGAIVLPDVYYHIAVTHMHGINTKIYLNGVLMQTNTYTGNESSAFNLGFYLCAQGGSTSHYDGQVDQIRIYDNRVLTPYEITNLYNKGRGC